MDTMRSKALYFCSASALMFGLAGLVHAQDEPGSLSNDPSRFDRIPERILERQQYAPSWVASSGLRWTKPVVTVAFYGGEEGAYGLIEDAALEWTPRTSSLQLSFRNADGTFRSWSPNDIAPAADIRIAFSNDQVEGGYWSVIGTMANDELASWQTMNLQGFNTGLRDFYDDPDAPEWLASYDRGTIIHEFGHALALEHEQFHPDCQRDLDLEQAVIAYAQDQDWTVKQARYQLDAGYYFDSAYGGTQPDLGPAIDQASIMLYHRLHNYARSGDASPCKVSLPAGFASRISAQDREAFNRLYPPGATFDDVFGTGAPIGAAAAAAWSRVR